MTNEVRIYALGIQRVKTSVLKEDRILRYLHNNSAMLILMLSSKVKLSYTILIHTLKTFVAAFFYDDVFYTLYFLTVSHFSLKMS